MSELEQGAKEAFMASVSLHLLTKLSDGSEEIVITSKIPGKIGKDGLTKRLKAGSVLSEDYNKNSDTITEWRRIKGYISDLKEIIRGQEDLVVMSQEDIARIELGDPDGASLMSYTCKEIIEERQEEWVQSLAIKLLPGYKYNLEKWQKSLVTKKQQLKEAKIEFEPLKASIKSLKDKFELYISQLEVAE